MEGPRLSTSTLWTREHRDCSLKGDQARAAVALDVIAVHAPAYEAGRIDAAQAGKLCVTGLKRILRRVVVDGEVTVTGVYRESHPVGQRVVDRLSHRTLG